MSDFSDIVKLSELFNLKKEESDSDLEETPAIPKGEKKINAYAKVEPEKNKYETVEEYIEDNEKSSSDWKKTPQYDISYRQKVTPEDMFLGVGSKTPSTFSCEDMIVTIALPDEKYKNMDLKVFSKNIELNSPRFYLNIPLPQQIDPQKGNAQWDNNEEKLIVTLRMDREFDFLNF